MSDDSLESHWADVRGPQPEIQPCKHPRWANGDTKGWYGDPEYGTTFCGVCHKDITNQVDQLLDQLLVDQE